MSAKSCATAGDHVPKDVAHARSLELSTAITRTWYQMYGGQAVQITPADVVSVLNDAKVTFVMMGAHAIGGWLEEARATQDVDLLVERHHHDTATKAIVAAFPNLIVEDGVVVTRFRDPDLNQVVIDPMKPKHAIHQAVFDKTIAVGTTHRIPCLEMAMATKFSAMVSRHRQLERKYQDVADFLNMAKRNLDSLDREKLSRFGEIVFPGGGEQILQTLDDLLNDRQIKL